MSEEVTYILRDHSDDNYVKIGYRGTKHRSRAHQLGDKCKNPGRKGMVAWTWSGGLKNGHSLENNIMR